MMFSYIIGFFVSLLSGLILIIGSLFAIPSLIRYLRIRNL